MTPDGFVGVDVSARVFDVESWKRDASTGTLHMFENAEGEQRYVDIPRYHPDLAHARSQMREVRDNLQYDIYEIILGNDPETP